MSIRSLFSRSKSAKKKNQKDLFFSDDMHLNYGTMGYDADCRKAAWSYKVAVEKWKKTNQLFDNIEQMAAWDKYRKMCGFENIQRGGKRKRIRKKSRKRREISRKRKSRVKRSRF